VVGTNTGKGGLTVNEGAYSAICAQINSGFEIQKLVQYIGWKPDKMVRSGDVYLVHCPIHQDSVFRTLVLNPRNNTYHCKHVNCAGNRPSDFLDLLVKVFNKSLPEVIHDVVTHFGPEYFRLSTKQVAIIGELVKVAREQRLIEKPA